VAHSIPKKCGLDQPSRPHCSWNALVCLSVAEGGGTTVPVRQRSLRALSLPVRVAKARFEESRSRNRCGGQRPNRLIEPAVEEAAVPGQPARARAHFRFPLAIHSRELPAPTGVTAIIVRQALKVPTFSMNPLWGTTLRVAIEKHYRRVNKLWTMRLPCGRLRKMWKESFSREF